MYSRVSLLVGCLRSPVIKEIPELIDMRRWDELAKR
jgi:hypothetical protein